MVQYQAAQQEALHTFSIGLQRQGPTGNGGGGSGTLFGPEILPPPQNINFIPNNNPPPNFTRPLPDPGGASATPFPDPPPQGPPPPPPPPPPAPGLVVELENQTGIRRPIPLRVRSALPASRLEPRPRMVLAVRSTPATRDPRRRCSTRGVKRPEARTISPFTFPTRRSTSSRPERH